MITLVLTVLLTSVVTWEDEFLSLCFHFFSPREVSGIDNITHKDL